MDINDVLKLVENYDTICIFTHINADSDALGSQLGLKEYLKIKYSDKEILAIGSDKTINPLLKYSNLDLNVEDNKIKSSLGIIVDTSNKDRVEDKRYTLCKQLIVIDHHPNSDIDADVNCVNVSAAAASQIVTLMIKQSNDVINKVIATLLFGGILADTIRFSIPSTTQETFEAALYLINYEIDIAQINRELFCGDINEYKFNGFIRNNTIVVDGKFAYVILTREDYINNSLSFSQAKDKVFVLGEVESFEMWALFIETKEKGVYHGSLRSRKEKINDIANKYDGGGHNLACGVKNLSKDKIATLIKELINRL